MDWASSQSILAEPNSNSCLGRLFVSVNQLEKVIKDLDPDKGPGTNEITNYCVKNAAPGLMTPLLLTYNASLTSGVFPAMFKNTMMHPIFKLGDCHDVRNYRPIAILKTSAYKIHYL